MELATREVDAVLVIDIIGKLDTQTAGPAEEQLLAFVDAEQDKFLINLSGLDFVSSAGLRVILRAAKKIRGNAGPLKVCSAKGVVKEVLEISGFDSLLDLYEEEGPALSAF